MSIFNSKKENDLVVASLDASECQLNHFCVRSELPTQLDAQLIQYAAPQVLYKGVADWCRQKSLKNKSCCWVLSRELYKTYTLEAPEVADKEILENIKWQVKDLLEHDIDDVLMSYYKPCQTESQKEQIIVVTVERRLIESIIYLTKDAGLLLKSIEIEELAIGQALLTYLSDNKIIGYVGEDKNGLAFNFYKGDQLAFTRYKKGQFIPNPEEFSLDSEKQQAEEIFLLETQRTMDYVVSQLFRKPVDCLLLQPLNPALSDQSLQNTPQQINEESSKEDYRFNLAQTMQELIEVPVNLLSASFNVSQEFESFIKPGLADVGMAMLGNR